MQVKDCERRHSIRPSPARITPYEASEDVFMPSSDWTPTNTAVLLSCVVAIPPFAARLCWPRFVFSCFTIVCVEHVMMTAKDCSQCTSCLKIQELRDLYGGFLLLYMVIETVYVVFAWEPFPATCNEETWKRR